MIPLLRDLACWNSTKCLGSFVRVCILCDVQCLLRDYPWWTVSSEQWTVDSRSLDTVAFSESMARLYDGFKYLPGKIINRRFSDSIHHAIALING